LIYQSFCHFSLWQLLDKNKINIEIAIPCHLDKETRKSAKEEGRETMGNRL
jgi:hypothetical protein